MLSNQSIRNLSRAARRLNEVIFRISQQSGKKKEKKSKKKRPYKTVWENETEKTDARVDAEIALVLFERTETARTVITLGRRDD